MSSPEAIAQLFQALADPTRLRLLLAVRNESPCATDLHTALRMSQPRVARHLKILVEAGLLVGRREGRFVRYSLPESGNEARIVESALAGLAGGAPSAVSASGRRGPAGLRPAPDTPPDPARAGGRVPEAPPAPAGPPPSGDEEPLEEEAPGRGIEDFLL